MLVFYFLKYPFDEVNSALNELEGMYNYKTVTQFSVFIFILVYVSNFSLL